MIPVPLMGDRLIIRALRNGLEVLKHNENLFRLYLAALDEPGELDREWARFQEKPPTVQGAFGRPNDPFPLWSVVLGNERAGTEFLGNFMEVDPDTGAEQTGEVDEQAIALWLLCRHPDETRIHHQLAKSIIKSSTIWLVQQGLTELHYGGAQDMHPEELYLPSSICVRQMTWEVGVPAIAYTQLPAPKTAVYVHINGIEVDGHNGGVVPI